LSLSCEAGNKKPAEGTAGLLLPEEGVNLNNSRYITLKGFYSYSSHFVSLSSEMSHGVNAANEETTFITEVLEFFKRLLLRHQ
jgi:hypothetical protein